MMTLSKAHHTLSKEPAMPVTLTAPTTATPTAFSTVDPMLARAEFFFDLELAELTMTIPQAAPRAVGVAKY
jgi:hypothetical protein